MLLQCFLEQCVLHVGSMLSRCRFGASVHACSVTHVASVFDSCVFSSACQAEESAQSAGQQLKAPASSSGLSDESKEVAIKLGEVCQALSQVKTFVNVRGGSEPRCRSINVDI